MDLNSAIIFFSVTHFLQHSYFKEFSCHETFKEIINYLEKVNRNLPKMRLSCQKQQRLMSWRGQVDRAEQLSSANTSPGLYLTLPWCTLQCFLFCFRPRERGKQGEIRIQREVACHILTDRSPSNWINVLKLGDAAGRWRTDSDDQEAYLGLASDLFLNKVISLSLSARNVT